MLCTFPKRYSQAVGRVTPKNLHIRFWSDQTKLIEISEAVVTVDLFLRDDAEGTTEHHPHGD